MKKLFSLALVLTFVLALSTGAFAAPAPKTAPVTLTASALTVKVGEPVTLTATTVKQGSSFTDGWAGATKISTVLNSSTESYVSTATFSSNTAGTYTVAYSITMSAGKSGVTFTGTSSVTITVINPATVIGAKILNVVAIPRYNTNDKLIGYDATGDVYALWSNGASTYYETVSFNFSPTQTIRNYDVTIDGVSYTAYDIVRPQ